MIRSERPAPDVTKPKVAYLVGRYPAVSHTFIQREVLALRERDVEVHTISIHRATDRDVLSSADRSEDALTFSVLPIGIAALLSAHLYVWFCRPLGYVAALRRAVKLARPGIRGLIWEMFYLAEAVVVWRHCRRLAVRHIHVHHLNQASDAAMLAIAIEGAGRWTWSYTMHGPDEFANVIDFRLHQKATSAAAIACISDFARAQLMSFLPPQEWVKLHVIHCGLLVEEWDPPAERAPGPDLRVLFVGRLVPVKGEFHLLDALRILTERDVPVEVVIIGDGPMRAPLEAWTRDHNLTERVVFAGSVGQDEIRSHFRDCDVFVLPSSAEGLPVVLMEAMAMELPVVTTPVAGIPELVQDGKNGFLVPPGRSDLIAEALARLAKDPDLRKQMGREGRARVLAEFDVRRCAQQLEAMFTEVLRR